MSFPRHGHPSQSDDASVAEVVALLWRNKLLLLPLALVSISVTTFYHYYHPAFTSESTILSKRIETSPFQQVFANIGGGRQYSADQNASRMDYALVYLRSEDF